MKIRTNFVSNSSSTSFTVPTKDFKSIWDLAMFMVPARGWDSDTALVEQMKKDKAYLGDKVDICFPSCNYDTYIRRIEPYFVVATCNNHNWYDLFKHDMSFDYPKEIVELANKEGYDDDYREWCESYLYKTSDKFWFTKYRVIGQILPWQNTMKTKFRCFNPISHTEQFRDLIQTKFGIFCSYCLINKGEPL